MDSRITKNRLKQLLSYDLWKIIAIIIAGIFVWSLLFTTLGARLSEGEMLNIYAYNVHVSEDSVNGLLDTEADNGKYYSYEVRETKFYDFGAYSSTNTTIAQQFAAWTSVGQLDVMFISDKGDEIKSKDADGNEQTSSLYDNYSYYFYDLNTLCDDAFNYCKRHGNMKDDGTFDEDAITTFFEARMKNDNFYRHGMVNAAQEIDRFKKIRDNATILQGWLNDPALASVWRVSEFEDKSGKITWKTGVKLDELESICGANTETGKKLSQLCSTGETDESGSGAIVGKVVLSVFNNSAHQEDLVYESLAFLVKTIKTYTSL